MRLWQRRASYSYQQACEDLQPSEQQIDRYLKAFGASTPVEEGPQDRRLALRTTCFSVKDHEAIQDGLSHLHAVLWLSGQRTACCLLSVDGYYL